MGLHVLLVDDEVEIMELYIRYLRRSGFPDIAAVHSAQDAVVYIERHKPDLVFLDISLGDESHGNGMEVLERIRQSVPLCRICMMSAYRDEYEQASLDKGAYAFIAKPFQPDTLLRIMRELENHPI